MTVKSTNYLELLPRKAIKQIADKLQGKVSYRQIQRVLNGEYEDHHGIIELALKKIEQHQKKMQKREDKKTAIIKKAQPLT